MCVCVCVCKWFPRNTMCCKKRRNERMEFTLKTWQMPEKIMCVKFTKCEKQIDSLVVFY